MCCQYTRSDTPAMSPCSRASALSRHLASKPIQSKSRCKCVVSTLAAKLQQHHPAPEPVHCQSTWHQNQTKPTNSRSKCVVSTLAVTLQQCHPAPEPVPCQSTWLHNQTNHQQVQMCCQYTCSNTPAVPPCSRVSALSEHLASKPIQQTAGANVLSVHLQQHSSSITLLQSQCIVRELGI